MKLADAVHEVVMASRWRITTDASGSSRIADIVEVPFEKFIAMQRAYVAQQDGALPSPGENSVGETADAGARQEVEPISPGVGSEPDPVAPMARPGANLSPESPPAQPSDERTR